MERICLDTNVLIDHKRAKKSVKANTFLFRSASGYSQLAISMITDYELLRGNNQDEDQYGHQMFGKLLDIFAEQKTIEKYLVDLVMRSVVENRKLTEEEAIKIRINEIYNLLGSDAMWVIIRNLRGAFRSRRFR